MGFPFRRRASFCLSWLGALSELGAFLNPWKSVLPAMLKAIKKGVVGAARGVMSGVSFDIWAVKDRVVKLARTACLSCLWFILLSKFILDLSNRMSNIDFLQRSN